MFHRVTILLILFHISHSYCVYSSLKETAERMISDIKKGNEVTYDEYGRTGYDVLNVLKGADICHVKLKRSKNLKILYDKEKINEFDLLIEYEKKERDGLKEITEKFMPFFKKNAKFSIEEVKKKVSIKRRRIYDILHIFAALGLLEKKYKGVYTHTITGASFDNKIAQLKSEFESTTLPIKNTINSISSDEGSCTTSVDSNESLTDRSTDFSDEELSNHSVDPYPSICTVNGYSLPIEYLYQREQPIVSTSTKIKSNALKYLTRGKHIFSNQKNNDYFWYDKETKFYYKVDIYNVLLDNEDVYFNVNIYQSYLQVIGSSFFYKVNFDEPYLQFINRGLPYSESADESKKK